MPVRECDGCTICCEWPSGEVYGHTFYMGKKCNFLGNNKCTIYDIRPQAPCKNYQCAWLQGLFPIWMKPNECGVLISVEHDNNVQFLRVTTLGERLDSDIRNELRRFSKDNNCKIIFNTEVIYEN